MEFRIFDLGLIDFNSAWQCQKEAFLSIKNNALASALIVCQHHPVITLGRAAHKENILATEGELREKNIKVYEVERGGDVTYHGPGQLTLYPVINLNYFKKDIHWFLRELENIAIDYLADFGVYGLRITGLTGVWVGRRKICSIGIAIKNWVTFHGLSLNIKQADLENFGLIRPCGLDIEMTSLETILERNVNMDNTKENLILKFKDFFSLTDNLLAVYP